MNELNVQNYYYYGHFNILPHIHKKYHSLPSFLTLLHEC